MIDSLDTYSGYIAPSNTERFSRRFIRNLVGWESSSSAPKKGSTSRLSPSFTIRLQPKPGSCPATKSRESASVPPSAWRPTKPPNAARPPGSEVLLTDARGPTVNSSGSRYGVPSSNRIGHGRSTLPDGRWDFMMQADPRFAYIRIEIFGEKTTAELREALASVVVAPKGCSSISATTPVGFFLRPSTFATCSWKKGTIVSTSGRHEHLRLRESRLPALKSPNPSLSSFSSIISRQAPVRLPPACLQDHGRATILGERTFGKGSVQNVIELEGRQSGAPPDLGHYFPPSGRNIHRRSNSKEEDEWGVHPDPGFEVELDEEKTIHVFERLRGSRQSLAHQELRQEERPADAAPRRQQAIDRDPSIAKDPQLLRAIEALDQRLMVPTAP